MTCPGRSGTGHRATTGWRKRSPAPTSGHRATTGRRTARPGGNIRSARHGRRVGQRQPREYVLNDPVPVRPLVLARAEVDGHRIPEGTTAVAEAHVLLVQVVPGATGEELRRRGTPGGAVGAVGVGTRERAHPRHPVLPRPRLR